MTTTIEPGRVRDRAPRILIVDDTEDARSLLRIKLSGQGGYAVVGEAVDGIDAVRQARLLQPELVILDMGMPGTNGLEAFEDQALSAGADRYVVKGGTMKELVVVIDSVLSAP